MRYAVFAEGQTLAGGPHSVRAADGTELLSVCPVTVVLAPDARVRILARRG